MGITEIKDEKSGRWVSKKGFSEEFIGGKEGGSRVPEMNFVLSVVVVKVENSDLEVLSGSVFGVEFAWD